MVACAGIARSSTVFRGLPASPVSVLPQVLHPTGTSGIILFWLQKRCSDASRSDKTISERAQFNEECIKHERLISPQ
jgi:hypothetical protein